MSRATYLRLLQDHADRVSQGRVAAFEATVLRTRSPEMLDVMAYLATQRRGVLSDIRRRGDGVEDVGPLHAGWTQRLARALALNPAIEDGEDLAMWLFDYLIAIHGPEILFPQSARFYGQLLVSQGRYHQLRDTINHLRSDALTHRSLTTDLLNPCASPLALDIDTWLGSLATLTGHDPADAFLLDAHGEGPTAFDRLTASAPAASIDGPTVSVIVPTFRPSSGLYTAVRSLVAQTWANLEILVVDDCSGPGSSGILKRVADLDERVEVISRRENGGAYAARNTGLERASGTWVTFQDDDDWSHPRRIEKQANILVARPDVTATLSRCIRANDDLLLSDVGRIPLAENASSLLFRREEALGRVGAFDDVRKGADTEFRLRIERAFGEGAVVELPDTLAAVRFRSGSLSRSDFSPGWRHPSRAQYREAYSSWHESTDVPHLDRTGPRPFPAPKAFVGSEASSTFDVVVVGDWRDFGGPQRSMLEEIDALRTSGASVAIAHLDALRFMRTGQRRLCEPLRRLLANGDVTEVTSADLVTAKLVLVRYPPLLQFPPPGRLGWHVGQLWIVANQAPCEQDGRDVRYVPSMVTEHATRFFGRPPRWVPQGPMVRDVLERYLDPASLHPRDNVGVLDPSAWRSDHVPEPGAPPRVGRYSRDHPMKFPADAQSLLEVYGDPRMQVTIMGGTTQVPRLLEERQTPSTWSVLPEGAVPPEEFLRDVDFFVHADHPTANEAFGRSALEAIVAGVVTILPARFAATFGDAALYPEPHEIADLIVSLQNDPSAYREVVDRASRIVESRFSHSAFLDLVAPVLGGPIRSSQRP